MDIHVCNVTKHYASQAAALADVSLTIRRGSFWTVVGPTGSGKTTLLRLVAGLIVPDAGCVRLDSRPVCEIPPVERSIAYLPQGDGLLPQWTVRQNLVKPLYWRRVPSDEIRTRVAEIATACKVEQYLDRYPHELSGGQRQRVGLAQVLLQPVSCLLLDEPFKHLDIVLRDPLMDVVRDHHRRTGQTIVCVTHDREAAGRLGEHMAVLREGRVVQAGTRSELAASPADPFVFSMISPLGIELFHGMWHRTDEGGVFSAYEGLMRVTIPKRHLPHGPTADTSVIMAIARHHLILYPKSNAPPMNEGVSLGTGTVVRVEDANGFFHIEFAIGRRRCSMSRETTAVPECIRCVHPGDQVAVVATSFRLFSATDMVACPTGSLQT
ncbi:sn-glycerol-3-phosphate ABC transporter ATP-binding protein UgpC [Thermostilla marina]